MSERYYRDEAARSMPAAVIGVLRAMNDHDLDRVRTLLPDDFVVEDHQHVGLGRLEGAPTCIAQSKGLGLRRLDTRPSALEALPAVAIDRRLGGPFGN